MEKYKFTSVVAQDLLDSFLSFFPELKEQSVDCRAGEASPLGECWCEGGWGPHLHRMPLLPGESPTGSSILPSDTLPGQCEPQAGGHGNREEGVLPSLVEPRGLPGRGGTWAKPTYLGSLRRGP